MDDSAAPQGFEEFYKDSFAFVHKLVSKLVGANEAWDVTQEAFVQVWRRWDELEGEDAPMRFAVAVAVRLSRSWLRRLYRTKATLEITLPSPAEGRPEFLLEPALSRLSSRQREAIVLCDIYGFNAPQAAAILGANPGTTRVHLSRGRARLRQGLEGIDEADVPVAAASDDRKAGDK